MCEVNIGDMIVRLSDRREFVGEYLITTTKAIRELIADIEREARDAR